MKDNSCVAQWCLCGSREPLLSAHALWGAITVGACAVDGHYCRRMRCGWPLLLAHAQWETQYCSAALVEKVV